MLLVDMVFVSIGFGINGALETFVSQASGLKNYKQCSDYLYKSRLIVTIYFLMSLVVLLNAESILLWIGQDKKVCAFA